jgi:hypothetical protein
MEIHVRLDWKGAKAGLLFGYGRNIQNYII